MNTDNVSEKSKQAIEVLNEIVNWWDEWNNSENPTELENPPIEEARKLLNEIAVQN